MDLRLEHVQFSRINAWLAYKLMFSLALSYYFDSSLTANKIEIKTLNLDVNLQTNYLSWQTSRIT